MDKPLNSFAKSLRKICKDRDMSQADLCRLTGLEDSNVSVYWHGKRSASLETIEKFAKALEMSPGDFLNYAATQVVDSAAVVRAISLLRQMDKVKLDAILPTLEQLSEASSSQQKLK